MWKWSERTCTLLSVTLAKHIPVILLVLPYIVQVIASYVKDSLINSENYLLPRQLPSVGKIHP